MKKIAEESEKMHLNGYYGKTKIRLSPDYILRTVAGEYMIVPIGQGIANFSGVISANETAAFLWEILQNETTQIALEERLIQEYGISGEQAERDVQSFLSVLSKRNMLEVCE